MGAYRQRDLGTTGQRAMGGSLGSLLSLLSRVPAVHRRRLGGMVFLAGLALSLWGAVYIHGTQSREVSRAFDSTCKQLETALEARFQGYAEVLRGLRSFFEASPTPVDRKAYNHYCRELQLQERLPGITGITYGRFVPVRSQGDFLREMDTLWPTSDLGRPFAFKPERPDRDAYVVVYGFPETSNLGAIGFNSASRQEQRASLEAAMACRTVVASGPLTLAQAPDAGPGIVMRLAVASPQGPGYINIAFTVRTLAEAALRDVPDERLGLVIEDVEGALISPVFSHLGIHGPPEHLLGRPLAVHRDLQVAGRHWRLKVFSEGGFVSPTTRWLPFGFFAGGTLLSLLFAGLIGTLDRMERWASRRAERMVAELAAGEARLDAITRVLPDLVLVLDEDGHIIEALGGQATHLAQGTARWRGRLLEEALPMPVASQLRLDTHQALDQQDIVACALALQDGEGTHHVEGRLVPAGFRHEDRRCVVWVGRDVTAQREEEARLRDVQKLESLGLLASGIAHDFNNLLSALRMNLTLAREDAEAQQPIAEYLDAADASITAASDLARQMMVYAGQEPLSTGPLRLDDLVSEMARLLQASVSRKTQVDWQLAEVLPQIVGDRAQLRQVILNLVVNASDAMEGRTGHIQVRTRLDADLPSGTARVILPPPPGPALVLEVQDDGCGMSAETLDRIFDPFFTTKATGRGLGLSAMLGILRAHGAGLAVQSQPQEGTTFRISFPIQTG